MKLTTTNVDAVINECLFKEGEDTSKAVIAEGVILKAGFHPERLAAHSNDIADMLADLPEPFKDSSGGGWSFLNACMNKDGEQWGEHRSIDALLTLGIAAGKAKILFDRKLWSSFPGGMPYFKVIA